MWRHFFSRKRFSLVGIAITFLVVGLSFGVYDLYYKTKKRSFIKFTYERSAQYHRPERNPVIVIPGILGSRLLDQASGLRVWGAFNGVSIDPSTKEGLQVLSLPIDDPATCYFQNECLLKDQKDSLTPDGVLDEINLDLFGLPVGVQAYANILSILGAGGYRDESMGLNGVDYGDEHFTCFQFDYDWRRDNVENARRLEQFIAEKKAFVRAEYKKKFNIDKDNIKFDIVAHSMGGLLARYFLRYGGEDVDSMSPDSIPWTGSKDVERLIMVGTPNAGAADSYVQLVEGFDVGKPVLPYYPPALLGTYPSIYQLLPRPRHKSIVWAGDESTEVDIYDSKIWEKFGWGLASESPETQTLLKNILPQVDSADERRQIALKQQARILKRTKHFHALIDKPAAPPKGLELFMVAGDVVETLSQVTIDPESGNIKKRSLSSGDGSVLRTSTLMDERVGQEWGPQLVSPISWSSALFLASDHLGLTRDPNFENNVLFWLLEDQRTTIYSD